MTKSIWPFRRFLMIALATFFISTVSAQRDFLSGKLTRSTLQTYLQEIGNWRDAQKAEVYSAIKALPDSIKQKLLKKADGYLDFQWPNLPATTYLEFSQNGNRTRYERIRGQRRSVLSALVIATLIDHSDQYMPTLINGLWAICEESTWAYPAHLALQRKYTPLPNPGEDILDLGSGSTAELLSWTYLLLEQRLGKVSGILPQRLYYELEKRILSPYLDRSDFWWMGFKGQSVNNWNPTVNYGVLLTALLTEKNPDRLDSLVYKTLQSVDQFINQYPEDGGCDEGPSYWSMAGGALISYLSKLRSATHGKIDIATEPLIAKMGSYIYTSHIAGNYFVNFGDAHARVTPNIMAVYEFGEACHNDTLRQFASWLAKRSGGIYRYLTSAQSSLERFTALLPLCRLMETTPAVEPLVKSSWLPDLQQLTVRSAAGDAQGLFLAAKGGTNGASHNHNDVGNFILYKDGQPALIDLGVGTYTAQTFSKDRYKIFSMQSGWHNLPAINGHMQKAGSSYRATAVKLHETPEQTDLTMDLAGAYPKEAGVKTWIRQLQFTCHQIQLKETYQLEHYSAPSTLNLITPLKVSVQEDHVDLVDETGGKTLSIYFNSKQLRPSVETRVLEDSRFVNSWGKQVYRIEFQVLSKKLKDSYSLRFTQPR